MDIAGLVNVAFIDGSRLFVIVMETFSSDLAVSQDYRILHPILLSRNIRDSSQLDERDQG